MTSIGIISSGTSAPTLRGERFIPDAQIYTAIYDSTTGIIYIGGDFTYLNAEVSGNNQRRLYAAAIDTKTNKLTSWNPSFAGPVHSMAQVGSNIYVAGDFMGSPDATGTSGAINFWNLDGTRTTALSNVHATGTKSAIFTFNQQNGHQVVEDGLGGFYIAGSFTRVNGQPRFRLAHINSSGVLSSWNPSVSASVNTLLKYGNNIYFGGAFSSVAATTRTGFAAVNTSGSLLTWYPSAGGYTTSYGRRIFNDLDNIYLLGGFLSIGGLPRHGGALVNTAGSILQWNALSYSYPLWAGVKIGTNVYVAGDLTGSTSGGSSAALLDKTTGDMASIKPLIFDGQVLCCTPDGLGGAYVGGSFTELNGTARFRLAQINSTGQLTTWSPSADATVYWMSKATDNIYIGGNFANIAATSRIRLAAVNTAGTLLAWTPTANGIVYSGAINGSNIYIGGAFTAVNNTVRNYLAAVNTTSSLLTWNPSSNSQVWTIDRIIDDLYIGGTFASIATTTRNRLAAVNTSGSLLTWDPSASSNVHSLGILGSNIYFGGSFTSVALTVRNRVAAVNTAGTLLGWNPSANANVTSIMTTGTNIYLSGPFTLLSSATRTRLAIVNTAGTLQTWSASSTYTDTGQMLDLGTNILLTGNFWWASGGPQRRGVLAVNTNGDLQSWNPSVSGEPYAMIANGDNIYFGGFFTTVSGTVRNRLAAVNTAGTLLAWDPSASSWVAGMARNGDNIYIGGQFTSVVGTARNYLAAINTSATTTTGLLSWDPSASGTVQGLDLVNGVLAIGSNSGRTGAGFQIGGSNTNKYLAVVNTAGSILNGSIPAPNDAVYSIKSIGVNLYFGGHFLSVGATNRGYLAAINTSGSLLSWNPSADNDIYSLDTYGSNIAVTGPFDFFATTTERRDFAVYDTAGTLLPTHARFGSNPEITTSVKYSLDGASLFITGNFTRTPGSRGYARVDQIAGHSRRSTDGIASSGIVLCILPTGDGGAYVGGNFSLLNGITRNNIAKVDSNGSVNGTYNPNANGPVRVMINVGSSIFIGGDFTQFDTTTRNYIAQSDSLGSSFGFAAYPNGPIWSMASTGTNIYLAGTFTSMTDGNGTVVRNRLAQINTAGVVQSWDPNANDSVLSISLRGANLYFGGLFASVGGIARSAAAAMNTAGSLLDWDPNPTGGIVHVVHAPPSTDNIFIGGTFTKVSGQHRYSIALVNGAGSLQTWDPGVVQSNTVSYVTSIVTNGSNTYFGGDFTLIRDRGNIGHYGVWATNGEETLVHKNAIVWGSTPATRTVNVCIEDGFGGVYLGGNFEWVSGETRNGLARIDARGQVTTWNPSAQAGSTVNTLIRNGSDLYVGGTFTSISNTSRQYIASINSTGFLSSWNPSANGQVNSLNLIGENIIIGGAFTSVAGSIRNRLALVNTSGSLLTWNPNLNGNTYSVLVDGNNIYVGGAFTSVGATTRARLALINTAGNLLSWDPSANDNVFAISQIGSNIYIGGAFTTIASISRSRLAAINTAGSLLDWSPSANANVASISAYDSNVYIAGSFVWINDRPRNYLAAVSVSGDVLSWNPNATSSASFIYATGTNVYVGGTYTSVGATARNYVAAASSSGYLTEWNPSAGTSISGSGIYALAVDGTTSIHVGGNFDSIGFARNRIAQISSSGSMLSLDANAGNNTFSTTVTQNTAFFIGNFTSIFGQTSNSVGTVNLESQVGTVFTFTFNTAPVVAVSTDQTVVILGSGPGSYGPIGNIVRISDNKVINI